MKPFLNSYVWIIKQTNTKFILFHFKCLRILSQKDKYLIIYEEELSI